MEALRDVLGHARRRGRGGYSGGSTRPAKLMISRFEIMVPSLYQVLLGQDQGPRRFYRPLGLMKAWPIDDALGVSIENGRGMARIPQK